MTPATHTGDTFFLLETASGRFLNLEDPDPADICLEDIAQGLARTTRFRGQARTFCSVAEHAVLVADQIEAHGYGPDLVLAGLHHDDAEAFLGDVPTPLKAWIGEAWRALERRMDTAICEALKLPFDATLLHDLHLKTWDTWALKHEASLLPSGGSGWRVQSIKADLRVPWARGALSPEAAYSLWLKRHDQLTHEINPGGVTS